MLQGALRWEAFEDGTPHGSVFQVRRDEIFTGKRAVCVDANATGGIVYSSSDEDVVRVDGDGQLTFVAYGSGKAGGIGESIVRKPFRLLKYRPIYARRNQRVKMLRRENSKNNN